MKSTKREGETNAETGETKKMEDVEGNINTNESRDARATEAGKGG